jgi:hypothetical protein
VGFNDVIEGGLILDDFYILTHKPAYMNKHMPYVNIHGHTHSQDMAGSKHINISIEKMGYKPILFEDLKKLINEKEKETMEEKMTMIQAKMIQKVEEDYDKYWERYDKLTLEEKQKRVYQNYILEEMLHLIQLGVITNDETAQTIYEAEDSVSYLVNDYQANRDMALAEEEIKDFLLELQGE